MWRSGGALPAMNARAATGTSLSISRAFVMPWLLTTSLVSSSQPLCSTDSAKALAWRAPVALV